MHEYPKFMFCDSLGSLRKIKIFNDYVYRIIHEENSDVLILGIPGGIMPLSPFNFSEFGELAFLTNLAVPCDYGILTLYYQQYTSKSIETLVSLCKYRFNAAIKAINVTNKVLLIPPDEKKNKHFAISYQQAKDQLKQINAKGIAIFHTYDTTSIDSLCENLRAELANSIYEE